MNVIPLILSLIMMFSCSEQENMKGPNISVAETKGAQEESEYLYEIDLHRISTLYKINKLLILEQEYLYAIEQGDESAVEKLETLQNELRVQREIEKYFLKLPKGPIPLPPGGCLQESNLSCVPLINITKSNGIITYSKNLKAEFVNDKEEIVGKGTDIEENEFGLVLKIETKFEGKATLILKSHIGEFGEIISEIPVYLE